MDLLIFNPPYVPTEDQEVENAQSEAKIAGSWAGGAVGMDVTDCLLAQAPVRASVILRVGVDTDVLCVLQDLLASGGKFYLVAVPQNHPQDILSRMQAEGGLESQVRSWFTSHAQHHVRLNAAAALFVFRECLNDELAGSDCRYCVSSSLEERNTRIWRWMTSEETVPLP